MATKRKGPGDEIFDFIGFAPDAPTDAPGACSVMDNAVPTTRGWRAAPTEQTAAALNHPTLSFPVMAFHQLNDQFNSAIIVEGRAATADGAATIGTATIHAAFHPAYSAAYANITGPVYALGGWRNSAQTLFLSFGQYILCKGSNTLAAASVGVPMNTFAPVTGGPVTAMSALVSANRFVLAFDFSYGWQCSARDNHASWTADPATLAAFGQLPEAGTANRSAVSLGDEVLLFKGKDVWRGNFEPNNEEVWVWRQLGLNVTSMTGPWIAAKYKQGAVFLCDHGLLYYDGANLVNLMDERMRQWFATRIVQPTYRNSVVVDEWRDLIWVSVVMYTDDDATTLPSGESKKTTLVCDPKTKRWARYTAKEYLNIFQGPVTYPGHFFYGSGATNADIKTVWGMPMAAPYRPLPISAPAVTASAAQIVTNDFGHPFGDVELTRANLKFIVAPTGTAPIATGLYRNNLDGSLVTASPVARSSDGHFDVRQQARWHRLQFDLYGDWELDGYAVDAGIVGVR